MMRRRGLVAAAIGLVAAPGFIIPGRASVGPLARPKAGAMFVDVDEALRLGRLPRVFRDGDSAVALWPLPEDEFKTEDELRATYTRGGAYDGPMAPEDERRIRQRFFDCMNPNAQVSGALICRPGTLVVLHS
jgi:hypothetical protein